MMAKTSKRSKKHPLQKHRQKILWTLSILVIGVSSWTLLKTYGEMQVHALNSKGFHNLAADSAWSLRQVLSRSKSGCREALTALSGANQVKRLGWFSEACLNHGIVDDEAVFLGRASYFEMVQNTRAALKILSNSVDLFPKSPASARRKAQIHFRLKEWSQASVAYEAALSRAPADPQLSVEVIGFYANQKNWSRTRELLQARRTMKFTTIDAWFFLAHIAMKIGDKPLLRQFAQRGNAIRVRLSPTQQKEVSLRYQKVIQKALEPPKRLPARK